MIQQQHSIIINLFGGVKHLKTLKCSNLICGNDFNGDPFIKMKLVPNKITANSVTITRRRNNTYLLEFAYDTQLLQYDISSFILSANEVYPKFKSELGYTDTIRTASGKPKKIKTFVNTA